MIWWVKHHDGKYTFLERNNIKNVDRMALDIRTPQIHMVCYSSKIRNLKEWIKREHQMVLLTL